MRALRGKAEATEHCLRVRSPMRSPKTRQGWSEVNTAIILDRGCKIGRFSCRRLSPQLVTQPFDETASDTDRSFPHVMALPFDLLEARGKIGTERCRERVCKYVAIKVAAVQINKNQRS